MDRKIVLNLFVLAVLILTGIGGYVFFKNKIMPQEDKSSIIQKMPDTGEPQVLPDDAILSGEEVPISVLEAGGDPDDAESEINKYQRDIERIKDLSRLKALFDTVLAERENQKPLPTARRFIGLGTTLFGLSDERKEIREQITNTLEKYGLTIDKETFEDPWHHTYMYGYASPDGNSYFLIASLESNYFKNEKYCHPLFFLENQAQIACSYILASKNAPESFLENVAQDEKRASRDAERVFLISRMVITLELYYDDHGRIYPPTMLWSDLVKTVVESGYLVDSESFLVPPGSQETYRYTTSPDRRGYVLQTMLESNDHSKLQYDADGVVYGIQCDDPYYCYTQEP